MMKILRKLLFFGAIFLVASVSNAQSSELIPLPKENIPVYINEVYGDGLISFKDTNPNRFRQLKSLLNDRVFFMQSSNAIEKAENITDVQLFNKYNSSLAVDLDFDINKFNPLKYELPLWTVSNTVYKLGNSTYYLVILGQNFNK